MEVVLAQAGWVVSGCEHVGGRQRRGEVVARLVVDVEVVLVERLQVGDKECLRRVIKVIRVITGD